MSDRDPFEQLRDLRTGPVAPLAPAEVRRLGDRRRARRTAASAVAGTLAVLAVVVPAGLYATRGGDAEPKPPFSTNSSSATPSRTASSLQRDDRDPATIGRGAIPADFPLDIDWFDPGGEGRKEGPAATVAVDPPEACGTAGLSAGRASGRLAVDITAPEYGEQRELRIYPDAATAAAVLAQIRAEVSSCTSYQAEGPITMGVMPVTVDTGYDTVAFAQTQEPYATGFFITRVGRAIVQIRAGGEWMTDSLTTIGADEYTTLTRKLAGEMCALTVDGCGTTPDAGQDDVTRTELLTLAPVTADGDVVEGYTVAAATLDEGLECTPTPSAPAHDAYTCGASAAGLTACWKESPAAALCLTSPNTTRLVRVGVSTFHRADSAPTAYQALELANGDRCLFRHGGAGGRQEEHPDWVQLYTCPSESVWGPPGASGVDTSKAAWTVRVGDATGTLRTVPVARAWVLAVAGTDAP